MLQRSRWPCRQRAGHLINLPTVRSGESSAAALTWAKKRYIPQGETLIPIDVRRHTRPQGDAAERTHRTTGAKRQLPTHEHRSPSPSAARPHVVFRTQCSAPDTATPRAVSDATGDARQTTRKSAWPLRKALLCPRMGVQAASSRPCRFMTALSAVRSGGPPAPRTSATSRKYAGPILPGENTTRARAGTSAGLEK